MKTISSRRPGGDVPEVLQLLTRQRDLYKQLEILSQKQAKLVELGQTEALLTVLSERQYLVDSLMELNASLQVYRQRWDAISAQMSQMVKDKVNGLVDEVEKLLTAIMGRDEVTQKKLEEAKAKTGMELNKTRQSQKVMGVYRGTAAAAYQKQSQIARVMDNRG